MPMGWSLTSSHAVVIGGTLLTGGVGYVFGTLFGVLITGLIQMLIMFNGELSSWWTRIAIGLLTLLFIGVQSAFTLQKRRRISVRRQRAAAPRGSSRPRQRRLQGQSALDRPA